MADYIEQWANIFELYVDETLRFSTYQDRFFDLYHFYWILEGRYGR